VKHPPDTKFRNLLGIANRRLDLGRPAVRALLVLLALGAVAAIGAGVWMAYIDTRNAAIVVNDPRELYVNGVRQKVQATTELELETRPQLQQTGSPLLRLQVNHRGELIEVEVVRTSGFPALDAFAMQIVKSSAPFEPFPPEMRRMTYLVVVMSEFHFR
jgi:TonB family protein